MKLDSVDSRQLSLFEGPALPAGPSPRRAETGRYRPHAHEALSGNPDSGPGRQLGRQALGDDGSALRKSLQRLFRGRLGDLVLTSNRTTIASYQETGQGRLRVRLHRCFVGAPAEVLVAVADFATATPRSPLRRHSLRLLRRYFESSTEGLSNGVSRRSSALEPRGAVHDLRRIHAQLNSEYFSRRLQSRIGWSRGRAGKRRRSIRLGSYCRESDTIVIHPALDEPWVPAFFVESIVFHEMLHAVVPPLATGRRRLHHDEFLRREAEFRYAPEAQAWLERHLTRLLNW